MKAAERRRIHKALDLIRAIVDGDQTRQQKRADSPAQRAARERGQRILKMKRALGIDRPLTDEERRIVEQLAERK